MTVCTYDNPATMSRECWRDGKLLYHYYYRLLPPFAKKPTPGKYFSDASTDPWKAGQIVGDASAMSAT